MKGAAGWIVAVLLASVCPAGSGAWGACGGSPRVVRDPGLDRAWRVVEDCDHPERPARLVEAPWPDAVRPERGGSEERRRTAGRGPEVRAGMAVMVVSEEAESRVALRGTALSGGDRGTTVAVRAGLRGTIVRGRVRGPALVELVPGAR